MPDSTLDKLEAIRDEIRQALDEQRSHPEMLPLYRRRRELVGEAVADRRRQADIARALEITRERVRQLIDAA
jgi:hypothetical protein